MDLGIISKYMEVSVLILLLLCFLAIIPFLYFINTSRKRRISAYLAENNFELLKPSAETVVKQKYGFNKSVVEVEDFIAWKKQNLSGYLFNFLYFPGGKLITAIGPTGITKGGTGCVVDQITVIQINEQNFQEISKTVCQQIKKELLAVYKSDTYQVSLTNSFGPLCLIVQPCLEGEGGFNALINGAISLNRLIVN